jgi:uncharacterized surface protein with fasciclin (FAS1) repeats
VVHTISQVLVPALTRSIYDTAVSAGLTTLAALLTQAGLASTFSAPGSTPSYTVFAPTNAAFAAIPAPLVDWLTNTRAANAAALGATLRYHVLSGAVASSAIPAGGSPVTTLCAGCTPALSAFNVGGTVTLRNGTTVLATVATPNVACTNGVVHVVGAVLVPVNQGIPTRDVVQTALTVPALSNLTNALVATGLVPALTIGPNTSSFTVFAPVNSGWSGVPASVSSNLTTLTSVLQYHVLVGRVYAADLPDGVAVVRTTLSGQTLSLLRSGSAVTITSTSGNAATVLTADIDTSK